jgi:hypothetical protein
MAALLWSARPDRPGRQVREELLKSARDLGLKGHDWETGHGHVALPDLPGN